MRVTAARDGGGELHRSPAEALWWGDVMTDNAGKDARGPDLVWHGSYLGAPPPSPAWDCGGVMWVTDNAG